MAGHHLHQHVEVSDDGRAAAARRWPETSEVRQLRPSRSANVAAAGGR